MIWNKIRKIGTTNWHLKLMSLALAVLSWFLVTEAGIDEITIKRVPVEVLGSGEVSVWAVSSSYLRIKLTGPAAELRRIRPEDIKARYVVGDVDTPEGLWTIDVDCKEKLNFGLPAGVQIAEVFPSEIKIKLVSRKMKEVSVEAQLVGRPRQGFEIGNVRIIPQRVNVEGPAPIFEDLRAVQTLPINCNGRSESFTRQMVELQKMHKKHELRIEETVEVTIEIFEELDTRVLDGLKVMIMKPAGFRREVIVSPDTIDVTVEGQKQILAVLKPDKVVPFIRVVQEEGGEYKLPLEVSIYLDGIKVVGVLPNVDVTVGK